MNSSHQDMPAKPPTRVQLVAPVPPPYGGMALQAMLLQKLLQEDDVSADLFGHTQPFLRRLRLLERAPGVRKPVRAVVFDVRFRGWSRDVEVVHVVASSWLKFLLVAAPVVVMAGWGLSA